MVTETERQLAVAAARSRLFFADYMWFVHDWDVRAHQRRAVSALQALADGCLLAPGGSLCEACAASERAYIAEFQLPYETGFRAACGVCPTTNQLLWLAAYGLGKTDTLIEWLAWMIGNAIEKGTIPQAGWVSYADDVADLRSVAIRDTIEGNPRYKFVFPNALPDKKKGWGEGEWFLKRSDPGKKDPTLRAAGITGAILAYRFPTALIADDPQDPYQIKSPTYRDDSWGSFFKVARSRATEGVTPMVVISNRWAEDDIPGRIMAQKDWAVVITPALDEYDETVFPPEVWKGIPCGKSTEFLHAERERDRAAFLTGYMCQPPSREGDIFQTFPTDRRPAPGDVEKCEQYWDTATTQKTHSDFNAMVEGWKLKNGRVYINKVLNIKTNDPTALMEAEYWRAVDEGLSPTVVLENATAGQTFALMITKKHIRTALHSIPGAGKGSGRRGPKDMVSRAYGVKGKVDEGYVYLPAHWEEWAEKFTNQLKAFPNGEKDDMVSAFVGLLERLFLQTSYDGPWDVPIGEMVRR